MPLFRRRMTYATCWTNLQDSAGGIPGRRHCNLFGGGHEIEAAIGGDDRLLTPSRAPKEHSPAAAPLAVAQRSLIIRLFLCGRRFSGL